MLTIKAHLTIPDNDMKSSVPESIRPRLPGKIITKEIMSPKDTYA